MPTTFARPPYLPVADEAAVAQCLAVAISVGQPLLLWGLPGEGKSMLLESVAQGLGRELEIVIGSVREAADFGGLPARSPQGTLELLPPSWARRIELAPDTVLLFDELTCVSPSVQAAMLRVVLERVVGDLALPDTVAIVAAANPPEVAADGTALAPPLANRFAHLWFEADPMAWAEGLMTGWAEPAAPPLLPLDPSALAAAEARWRGVIGAYVRRGGTLRQLPQDLDAQGGPWPSPRSWTAAARLAAAADAMGASTEVRDLLLQSSVGIPAGRAAIRFADECDLPDPEELLLDPTLLDVDLRGDQMWAVLGALVFTITHDLDEERWQAGWSVLARLVEHDRPDVAAVAARALANLRGDGWAVPTTVKAFLPILRQAGIVG